MSIFSFLFATIPMRNDLWVSFVVEYSNNHLHTLSTKLKTINQPLKDQTLEESTE